MDETELWSEVDDEALMNVLLAVEEQVDDVLISSVREDAEEEQTDDVMTSSTGKAVTEEHVQTDDVMVSVVSESHSIHQLRTVAFKLHNKRLDSLLHHNGIKRVRIPADGNCFFSAAALHLIEHNHQSLREALCFHMERNIDHYLGFFEVTGNHDEKRRTAIACIGQLRQNGAWNFNASDILPLALANLTKRRVKIFSSKLSTPHWDIIPSLNCGQSSSIFCPIYLALVAPRGQPEHYDGCLIERRGIYTEFGEAGTASGGNSAAKITQLSEEVNTGKSPDIHCGVYGQPGVTPEQPIHVTTSAAGSDAEDDQAAGTCPQAREEEQTDSTDKDTPKLTGVYITPPKTRRGRKRTAQPDSWKRNVRKQLKLKGQEYTNSQGKKIEAKALEEVDCSKCKLKCADKISSEERQVIFDTFYSLNNYERQKDFICRHVEQKNTRTYLDEDGRPMKKTRHLNRKYFLTVKGERMHVCKRFFQSTLLVKHSYIDHALEHCVDGTFCGQDRRGKSTPSNKVPEADRQRVREHIQSFPAVESHYCRKNTGRLYLDATLNVNRMFKMYVDACDSEGLRPVSASLYRDVFDKDFNLSFHKPKKDQCLLCNNYHTEKKANTLTTEREQEYLEHIQRKQQARIEKAKDKKETQEKDHLYVATFDMQAVLPTPYDLSSMTFYKRKLSMYNLSVFSLADKKASCYMWTEVEGQRGSNEIGTCLYKHLQSLPKSTQHVILYSDTCTGQNRNKFTTAALHHAVQNIPNIQIIDQKYLESGHSQMECDSMHATIERASKGVKIHHPDQWLTVCQCARDSRSNPYTVIPLTHDSFYDFKEIARNTMRNTKTDINNHKVEWLKIKWLRVSKADEDIVYFKYNMAEPFRQLKIKGTSRRGRPQVSNMNIPALYSGQLDLSVAKKKDLMDLCESGVIPRHHHEYYRQLPSSSATKDCMPDVDVAEMLDDTDDE